MTETGLLAHRITGAQDAPPLLLLNGGLMSIASWDRIIGPLEAAYQVVRCDFRGQLLSPGEPEPRLEAHVDDVIRLLDALGLEQVHGAGVSLGGLVGTLLASLHPERVRSLAVITSTERVTPAMWEETAQMRQIAREAAEGGDGGRVLDFLLPRTYTAEYLEAQSNAFSFYRHWVAGLPAVWFSGLAEILSALEGLDLTPRLGAIRCPTLILGAVRAARQALENAGRRPEEVDLIIVGTDSPDYLTPATSVVLQEKLGARNAGTFDVGCACASFPTGFAAAAGLIATNPGLRTVLVVEESVRAGRTTVKLVQRYPPEINHEGWPRLVRRLAREGTFALEDIDFLIFTQVRKPSIELVMNDLGLPLERTHTVMEEWGYTGSACVPMALHDAREKGKIKSGDLVVLVGSGVGYNQAAVAFRA